jgi:hypothetical protein
VFVVRSCGKNRNVPETAPPAPNATRSVAVIGGALALCRLAAALAPANPGAAIDRAQSLAAFERRLGLRVAPGVHAWLTARPIVATLAQLFYV